MRFPIVRSNQYLCACRWRVLLTASLRWLPQPPLQCSQKHHRHQLQHPEHTQLTALQQGCIKRPQQQCRRHPAESLT